MKLISTFSLIFIFSQSLLFSKIFDEKTIPLSIQLGMTYGLKASSLNNESYPPITFKELDEGLYVIPNAIKASYSTSGPWKLILQMKEQYHNNSLIGIYPQQKVLWRFANTNDSFKELKGQVDNTIKVGESAIRDGSALLDIAFDISWGTPCNFRYSFPFTFSITEHP